MNLKTCLITGANSGIGFELAKGMAKRGYKTILLCRTQKAGEIAKTNIIQSTNNHELAKKLWKICLEMTEKSITNT